MVELAMKKVKILFDEPTHKYTDEEGNQYVSVTQLIGECEPDYDHEFWAMYRALDHFGHRLRPNLKDRTINVSNKLLGFGAYKEYTLGQLYSGAVKTFRTPEEIAAEWRHMAKVACDWGHDKHQYLEDCINAFYRKGTQDDDTIVKQEIVRTNSTAADLGYKYKILNRTELENSPLSKSHPRVYKVLLNKLNDGYVLYAEKRVYSYPHKISGTIDVLAVKNGKDFYIIDWKTNKDELVFESGYFKKEWNKDRSEKVKTKEWVQKDDRYKYPLQSIQYCKGNGYSLQLSIYAYLCELWGMNCKGLILCHIRHEEKVDKKTGLTTKVDITPKVYPDIVYLKDAVHRLMTHRYNTINKLPTINRGVADSSSRRPVVG